MASLVRRPLSTRQQQLPFGPSPQKLMSRASASVKRPRSPDSLGEAVPMQTNMKRVKAAPVDPTTPTINDDDRRDKEHKRLAREAAKNEFRIKYTRAFPSFVFYFDLDQPDTAALRTSLVARVTGLGARVDDFFSNEITHLITDDVQTEDSTRNKENAHRMRASARRSASLLKSPIKLKGRAAEDNCAQNFSLLDKAQAFGKKIWSTTKLDSVLERCDVPAPVSFKQTSSVLATAVPSTTNQRSLTRLLASERLHGTTERDPTQKRHDFRYFSKSSYFVLVEDMKQELATIHALEYPITRGRDGKERGAWPVLHCHPNARGPFVEFDERERRRWEKSRRAEEDRVHEREQRVARELQRKKQEEARLTSRRAGDLRRSVSMNNLQRQVTHYMEEFPDLDADFPDTQPSANASGYLASTGTGAYIAASGNSVAIASTTGTTSTIGGSFRTLDLPAALRGRIQQQIVTSRKVSGLSNKGGHNRKPGNMGPPEGIPERGILRKSRSTNTLRLPRRDEGTKPGYCESCRVKFEDFESHIRDRKHRKFAEDDSNYLQLDFLLNRVRRRTLQQVEEEQRYYTKDSQLRQGVDLESYPTAFPFRSQDTVNMWDDEMDAEGEIVDVDE